MTHPIDVWLSLKHFSLLRRFLWLYRYNIWMWRYLILFLQNVLEGLNVESATISRNVEKELPFLALEKALMLLTKVGVSRQEAHAKIRETALKGKEMQDHEKVTIENLLSEPFYDQVVMKLANEMQFIILGQKRSAYNVLKSAQLLWKMCVSNVDFSC